MAKARSDQLVQEERAKAAMLELETLRTAAVRGALMLMFTAVLACMHWNDYVFCIRSLYGACLPSRPVSQV